MPNSLQSFVGPSAKRPKLCDFISTLPDSIIQHILSFLSTKQAIKTSVLSKRWRFLWMQVPTIQLDVSELSLCHTTWPEFPCIIFSVLLSNRAFALTRFCLKCHRYDPDFIQTWIGAALQRHVQQLDITLLRDGPGAYAKTIKFPHGLFMSKSLVSLQLEGGFLLDVPPCVRLPCLKTLHLCFLRYSDEESITRLLSGCINLESLIVKRTSSDKVKSFSINVATLKNLVVSTKRGYAKKQGYRLEICAPALKHLDLTDDLSRELLIESLPELLGAKVDVQGHWADKILTPLSNATHLDLTLGFKLSTKIAPSNVVGDNTFHSLNYLTLTIAYKSQNLLRKLLNESPKLQHLILILLDQKNKVPPWSHSKHVPECLKRSLKTFKIQGFKHSTDELQLVKYILSKAQCLEEVTISLRNKKPEEKDVVLKELLRFPRASTTCQLVCD